MLDEIRKKPQYVKQGYAFWGALLVTTIVVVVWIFSLTIRFEEVDIYTESESNIDTTGAFSQFWGELKSKAGSVWTSPPEGFLNGGNPSAESETETTEEQIETVEEPASTPAPPSRPVIQIATSSSESR